MATILVTGSSGTIGTRLCEKLLADGQSVLGMDWKPNKWKPEIDKVTIRVDLRDENAVSKAAEDPRMKDVDTIVHLAANARVYDLVEDPSMARDNFITLFNALEMARKNTIKKFIFASSRESYGNFRRDKYTEDLVRVEHCESPYTASKVGGEALVHSYAGCYGLEPVIFRFSNVYGMYDDSNRVIPLFIRLAAKNETLTVFGKDKLLDFTYIDDNVDGLKLCLQKYDKAKGKTFNLGNGEGTSIMALAETVLKLKNSASKIVTESSRTGEVTHYIADITHAKKVLGYDPKVKFDEGIKKTIEWYAKNA